MKVHPLPKKRNVTLRYNVDASPLAEANRRLLCRQKKLRRLPHIFEKFLELPFRSDADVLIEETDLSFRFTVSDTDVVDDVRADTIEIYPGVTKIVLRSNHVLYLSIDDLELDIWRFRLPATTRPELATASYVDGDLVVMVPKGGDDEDDEEEEEEEDRDWALDRFMCYVVWRIDALPASGLLAALKCRKSFPRLTETTMFTFPRARARARVGWYSHKELPGKLRFLCFDSMPFSLAPSVIAIVGTQTGARRDCRCRLATLAAGPAVVAFPRITSKFVAVALHRRPIQFQHHPDSSFTLTSTSRSSKSRSVVVSLHRQPSRQRGSRRR
ncbi:hypothetical protein Dimus_016904 [Dionaea muscipula]